MTVDLDALEAVLAKATPGEWCAVDGLRARYTKILHDARGKGDGYNNRVAETCQWNPATGPQTPPDEARANAAAIVALHNTAPSLIAEHRAALARVEALYNERNNLRHVVSHAQVAFRHYAQSHRAKGTPEGDAKAETNQQLAELMQAALEPKP